MADWYRKQATEAVSHLSSYAEAQRHLAEHDLNELVAQEKWLMRRSGERS